MFKKKREKRKVLWIPNVSTAVHMNIKLLALAEGKYMYQLCEELLIEAFEARRLRYESGDKPEEKEID